MMLTVFKIATTVDWSIEARGECSRKRQAPASVERRPLDLFDIGI
jgi:hypothetical protein